MTIELFMPDQFVVPQFIDAEDKILGPITVRQFLILMVAGFVEFIFYKLMAFTWFLVAGLPFITFAGIVAFAKINGMPFHFFILNIIQTFRRPSVRVWDKGYTTAELKAFMNMELPVPPPPAPRKQSMTASRLQELTLVVDTGGVYQPEE